MRGRLTLALFLAAAMLRGEGGEATLLVRARGEGEARLRLLGPSLALEESLTGRPEAGFRALDPGAYVLVLLAKGEDEVRLPLSPGPGETLVVDADLQKRTLHLVSTEGGALGRSFREEELRNLPGGRGVTALVETADAGSVVDRVDGGGLTTGDPGIVLSHGASVGEEAVALGPWDMSDPEGRGHALALPDRGTFDSVEVLSAALPVEWGTGGPTLVLVPKRPDEALRGEVGGSFVPDQTASSGDPPPIAELLSLGEGDFALSLPLVRGHLTSFLEGSEVRAHGLERGTAFSGEHSGLLLRLLSTASERTEIGLFGLLDRDLRPFPGDARFAGPGPQEEDDTEAVGLDLRVRTEGGGLRALSASLTHSSQSPQGSIPAETGAIDTLLDGPVPLVLGATRGTQTMLSLKGRLETKPLGTGPLRDALRVGALVERVEASLAGVGTPSEPVGETVDGIPARAWEYGWPGTSHPAITSLAVHGADLLRVSRLVLEAGLRLEHWAGSSGGPKIDWTTLLPRLGARFALTPEVALRGGYSVYGRRLTLEDLSFVDPEGPQGSVHLWTDANGNGRVDPGEMGPLVALVGPGGSAVAPDLKEPTTREFVLALDARFSSFRLLASGIHRRGVDLLGASDVGVPLSDYTVSTIPDQGADFVGGTTTQLLPVYLRSPASFGDDRYLLSNLPSLTTLYEGFEIAAEARVGEALRLTMGATASRAGGTGQSPGFRVLENDPGVLGGVDLDPNAATFAYGRLFSDRAYTLKLGGIIRAPWGILASALARYEDGQPFSRIVVATGLPQGAEPIMAFPRGLSRFHDVVTLDARFQKSLPLGRVRLAGFAQATNLLGLHAEIEEDVVTAPSFRRISAVDPPRVVTLGLRVAF